MQTHMQIYLTHHLSTEGFTHAVTLYPLLTRVPAAGEEEGTERTKGSGNMMERREEGESRDEYACGACRVLLTMRTDRKLHSS